MSNRAFIQARLGSRLGVRAQAGRHPPGARRAGDAGRWRWWWLGRPARPRSRCHRRGSHRWLRDRRSRRPRLRRRGRSRQLRPRPAQPTAADAIARYRQCQETIPHALLRRCHVGRPSPSHSRRASGRGASARQSLRADLPFHYLRQQAHLTAPASEFSLASKALGGAHQVAARLIATLWHRARRAREPRRSGRFRGRGAAKWRRSAGRAARPRGRCRATDGSGGARERDPGCCATSTVGSSLCFLRPAGIEDPALRG